DEHRGPVPERPLAAPQPGRGDGDVEIAAVRGRAAQARGREAEDGRLQDRHRLGSPDPQLHSRSVHHQGSAYELRSRQHAWGAGWGSGRFHRCESQARRLAAVHRFTIYVNMEKDDNAPKQDENQIVAERRAKLKALREAGNAFPNDFRRDRLAGELHASYGDKSNEELEPAHIQVAVAGRMMLKRVMGKAS